VDDSNFSHTRAVRGFDKRELKALSECLKVVIDDFRPYLGPSGDACCLNAGSRLIGSLQ
jgi:hypothetical protein